MKPLSTTAIAAAPALWAYRHLGSAAVVNWTPPQLQGQRAGSLYARSGGSGDQSVLLLHGLISSGDVFGAAYDRLASTHRIVVPDLLGFGRSLDEARSRFSVEDHLDALDELADQTNLLNHRCTIGAHSMGSALALHWAARHLDRVRRVVCWGAPIYLSPEAARTQISGSLMTRLFALDTSLAERTCAINCRHRTAAGWLAAALEPTLPIPVTRAASLHTWPAYRDAIVQLVVEADWKQLLDCLDRNGVRVELVWGTRDRVGDHAHARNITSGSAKSSVTLVRGADHHLPLTHPDLCQQHLALN